MTNWINEQLIPVASSMVYESRLIFALTGFIGVAIVFDKIGDAIAEWWRNRHDS